MINYLPRSCISFDDYRGRSHAYSRIQNWNPLYFTVQNECADLRLHSHATTSRRRSLRFENWGSRSGKVDAASRESSHRPLQTDASFPFDIFRRKVCPDLSRTSRNHSQNMFLFASNKTFDLFEDGTAANNGESSWLLHRLTPGVLIERIAQIV